MSSLSDDQNYSKVKISYWYNSIFCKTVKLSFFYFGVLKFGLPSPKYFSRIES